MKEKSLVQTSDIKKKAKQLKKEKSLKHHHALDEAAKFFGLTNYKNYQNESDAYRKKLEASLEAGSLIAMEEQDRKIGEKLKLIKPVFANFNVPIQDLINTFKKTEYADDAVQSICEKESSLKEYLELYFLKDSLEDSDWDLVTFAPYHIPQKASLTNLVYKFGKDAFDEETDSEDLFVEGEYRIQCKIMFEHTQDDIRNCHPGFFDDQFLSGTFELTIDRNKRITIENLDMGYDF
ncbi:MAG: hypothetical protein IPJ71_15740 [Bdellovibrionales bacterium]|nr:hypothetical protein [Bdellovibrionales bacterium]